jgi:hypothetical protein
MLTFDLKDKISETSSVQKSAIALANSAFQSILSKIHRFFSRVYAKVALNNNLKRLSRISVFIDSLNKANEQEVLNLMQANRDLEISIKQIKAFIKEFKIEGKTKLERLILENFHMTENCANKLRKKLYPPKPSEITDEEWKQHSIEMHDWAGDDWDDPSYDIYDVEFAPILIK